MEAAFDKIPTIKITEKLKLDLYESKRTKLKVAVANVPGPMIYGYFNFVTEANNDDGLPHTLEHLVFMGCRKYPGILDDISNGCLSEVNGTTSQTHTFYELFSAGSKGFLKILPVYLDYLLDPMLTKSQFITEVHHIDREGHDAGVIYNEQINESRLLMEQHRKKLFYPKYSGYGVNHGGSLKNLRETCKLKEIIQFHKKFYHLDNLFIIVCGIVDHGHLLEAIEKVECEYFNKIPKDFKRPFQKELTEFQLKPDKDEIIIPSDTNDKYGEIEISWQCPPLSNFYKSKALSILINYMNDASSKKAKMGIHRTDEELLYEFKMEKLHYEIIARFAHVPMDKMDAKFQENFLSKILMEHEIIDMEKIGQIIEKHKRNYLFGLDKNAHILIKDGIVAYQLYGTITEQLEERINVMNMLNRLKEEQFEFWCNLFREIFTKQCICLMAKQSVKEYENLKKLEKQRINERLKTLDLKARRAELDAAIKENERNKLGADLVKTLIVKDIQQFSLFPVKTIKNGVDLMAPNLLPNLPFYYFHKTESDIFQITIIFDTNSMSIDDRHFLLLWSKLIFQSPAKVDGKSLSFEEVQNLANLELVSKEISIGNSENYESFVFLKLCTHNQNFKFLPKWVEIFLQGITFDLTRVKMCARDLKNDAVLADNGIMANFLCMASAYSKNSNKILCNFMALQQIHSEISYEIKHQWTEIMLNVLKKLQEVRTKMLSSIVNIHFIGDPAKLPEKDWLEQNWNFLANQAEKLEFEYHADFEQNWEMLGKMRAIETKNMECKFVQMGKFDGSWKDVLSPEGNTMETLILAKYFSQQGGPIWNAIRGCGSAYAYPSIDLKPDRKSIELNVNGNDFKEFKRSYEESKKTVQNVLAIGKLDEKLFISAKGLLIHQLINEKSTLEKMGDAALLATIWKVGTNFTQELCNRIWKANADDVFQKAGPTFLDLFDDTKSIRCIALNKSSIGKLKKCFDKVEICNLKTFQTMPNFLNELNEKEIDELEDFQMAEFFDAINEQEEIEAENANLNVIPFEEFWTQNLTEEARIRAIVNGCVCTETIFRSHDEWPTIHVYLLSNAKTSGYFCKMSNGVICQLLEIDENNKPSVDEFNNNILPNAENKIRQKIENKTGLIFLVDKKCDCGYKLCNGKITNIIGL